MDDRRTTLYNLPPELAEHPQYEVLRELGRGGMGVVYLAKNKLMDRLEVLKVVNKPLLDCPGSMQRFLREIRSAARLNHPNIVTAYSALQIGELLVFAMEYIEGEDLKAVVKARGPLPVVNACQYVQQAAIGLQHAFEKGMVHRDIKPQNLMLAREGKRHIIKVLDFGLAKATREKSDDTALTAAGQMMGTPDYMAPEQSLDAAKADIRADIYSLGCTLYYLLTGEPPFRGNSLAAIVLAHQTAEARPLSLVRPEVPEDLVAVVRKMMAKELGQRYQAPAEVVKVLGIAGKTAAKDARSNFLSDKPASATMGQSEKETLLRAKPVVPPSSATQSMMPGRTATTIDARNLPSAKPILPVEGENNAERRESRSSSRKTWRIAAAVSGILVLLALLGLWASGTRKSETKETATDAPEPSKSRTLAQWLKQTPPLFRDEFDDPQSGWGSDGQGGHDRGYAEGKYHLRRSNVGSAGWSAPYLSPTDFACELVGRVTGAAGEGWGLSINVHKADQFAHGIQFVLTNTGQLRVERSHWNSENQRSPNLGPITHSACKPGTEWNRLLVVVRGQRVELYVNDILVFRPFSVDRVITPAHLLVVSTGPSKPALAEFERITVWPIDGLSPAPDD